MTAPEAIAFVRDVKKTLQEKDVWCTITEVNEPDLKFIKIEASIKVNGTMANISERSLLRASQKMVEKLKQ